MKEIPLTKGLFALVDDEDYEFLNQWKWCAQVRDDGKDASACRHVPSGVEKPKQKRIYMHRLLLGAIGQKFGDHIDGNGLNNQKRNLRPATNGQNLANSRKYTTNTSGFKGVDWHQKHWRAAIRVNQKKKFLGHFDDKLAAARAYDLSAISTFGEFAKTNSSMGLI